MMDGAQLCEVALGADPDIAGIGVFAQRGLESLIFVGSHLRLRTGDSRSTGRDTK
jgi:hypothetical protein